MSVLQRHAHVMNRPRPTPYRLNLFSVDSADSAAKKALKKDYFSTGSITIFPRTRSVTW